MDDARIPARPLRGLALLALLTLLLVLGLAAAMLPQSRAALPAALPGWAAWIPAVLAAALLPLAFRRHWMRIAGDDLEMRSAAGRERFALRDVRRIELARFSGRCDIYVILKGGGVRRVAARKLSDPDGVVAALGARGVPILRL